jgi:hypothetical protein
MRRILIALLAFASLAAHAQTKIDINRQSKGQLPTARISGLGTAATSNQYGDLYGLPATAAPQINSDWNATAGLAVILNKPTIGTAAAHPSTDFVLSTLLGAVSGVATLDGTGLVPIAQLPAYPYASLQGAPTLSAVATSGSYTDLSNRPATFVATTQRGKNAVTDLGWNGNGTTDNSTAISTALNNVVVATSGVIGSPEIFVPCGTYYSASAITVAPSGLRLVGEGSAGQPGGGCVTFTSDQPITQLWFYASGANNNQNGPTIEHIAFEDTSSAHNQVMAGLKMTNYANVHLHDVNFNQIQGIDYVSGTVTSANGSTTITGSGTGWPALAQYQSPAMMWLNGRPYEVSTINAASQVATLIAPYQETSTTPAYSLVVGGVGLMMGVEQGFVQYGEVTGLNSQSTRTTVFGASGPTSSSGSSRVNFASGFANCAGYNLPDSMAAWFGAYNDTHHWGVAENNCGIGVATMNSHQLDISGGEYETTNHTSGNGYAYPQITSCPAQIANSNVPVLSCSYGVLVESSSLTTTYGTRVEDNYILRYGTPVSFAPLTEYSHLIGNTYRANSVAPVLGGQFTSALDSGILTIYNNVTIQSGGAVPVTGTAGSGQIQVPCGNTTANGIGSQFINIYGAAGAVRYDCYPSGWAAQDTNGGPGTFTTLATSGLLTAYGLTVASSQPTLLTGSLTVNGTTSLQYSANIKPQGTANTTTTFFGPYALAEQYSYVDSGAAQHLASCSVNIYPDSSSATPTKAYLHLCVPSATNLPMTLDMLNDFAALRLPSSQVIASTDTVVTLANNPSWHSVTGLSDIQRTALTISVAATTLYTPAASGNYKACMTAELTQAATTSSTMPSLSITYTSAIDSAVKTIAFAGGGSTSNSTAFVNSNCTGRIYVLAGSNIQYATTGYASSGATGMAYDLQVTLENK